MQNNFNQPPSNTPESSPHKESVERVKTLFAEAERTLETEGREKVIPLLPEIYDTLIALNKRDKGDYVTIWIWNPEGDLTEAEFDELNLRRKKLSNAVGILATDVVKHDQNKI